MYYLYCCLVICTSIYLGATTFFQHLSSMALNLISNSIKSNDSETYISLENVITYVHKYFPITGYKLKQLKNNT